MSVSFWRLPGPLTDFSSMAQPDRLIIDRGDLASLVAVCRESDPTRVLLWHPTIEKPSPRARMATLHAETLGATLVTTHLSQVGDAEAGRSATSIRWLELVQAVIVARQHGIRRILDSVQIGRDVDRLGRLAEEAAILGDLSGLEPGADPVDIDLPLFDLSDAQLVELAMDLGVPFRQFWPCDEAESTPCGHCGGCTRWQSALRAPGVTWPWAAPTGGSGTGVRS